MSVSPCRPLPVPVCLYAVLPVLLALCDCLLYILSPSLSLSHCLSVSLFLSLSCSLFGTISLSLSLSVLLTLPESFLKHETCMQTHRAPTSPEHMDVLQEHQSDQEAGAPPDSSNCAQSELSHDESVSSTSDDEAHADRVVTTSGGGVSGIPESECDHEVNPGTDDQSMDRDSSHNSPVQFRHSPVLTDTVGIPHRKGIAACTKPELVLLLKRFGPPEVSTHDKSTKKEMVKLCQLHSIPVSRLKDLPVDDTTTWTFIPCLW